MDWIFCENCSVVLKIKATLTCFNLFRWLERQFAYFSSTATTTMTFHCSLNRPVCVLYQYLKITPKKNGIQKFITIKSCTNLLTIYKKRGNASSINFWFSQSLPKTHRFISCLYLHSTVNFWFSQSLPKTNLSSHHFLYLYLIIALFGLIIVLFGLIWA